jgi:hypothetical protein
VATKERRKYPRVPICDPISYISVDSEGNHLSQNLGTVQNASQNGLNIETYDAIDSEFALLSFVDLDQKLVEIKGRIAFSRQKQSGKFENGISLQGTLQEKLQFIKKLVRTYHYTKKDPRKFATCSSSD